MTSLAFWIYMADVSNSLKAMLIMVVGVASLASLITLSAAADSSDDDTARIAFSETWVKICRGSAIVAVVALFLAALTPGKETAYAMIAAQVGAEVLDDNAPELAKARRLLNQKLDDMLEEGEKQ